MKKIEEFVPEHLIEQMITALKENYERLPIGKPRTAVLQLLVPFIMNNKERGESVKNILSLINNVYCIAKKEDIEEIIAANTKDPKQDSTRRRRRSKTSDQNNAATDNSVQNASSESKKEASETEKDLSVEEKIPNVVGNENANGSVRNDQEHEKDVGVHEPEAKEDTAGGIQGQNESEHIPKNDGTFIVDDDIEDL